ncbi:hypothetical protein PANT111_10085 [Pantoea brenneri]|uniref:Uncharacterized protein n=1 Tax=Pantoea brenneri TaxID=472694 RepID=A0AAX3IZI0_9GAMM|nr:hypothetical protein PANT111_10085 [Pantoea brenneri]
MLTQPCMSQWAWRLKSSKAASPICLTRKRKRNKPLSLIEKAPDKGAFFCLNFGLAINCASGLSLGVEFGRIIGLEKEVSNQSDNFRVFPARAGKPATASERQRMWLLAAMFPA